MQIQIPYGHSVLSAELPAGVAVDIIDAPDAAPALDPLAAVNAALDGLVGDVKLTDWACARSVAIAINDKTRPVPHQHLLPPLLQRLDDLGIAAQSIRLYIATGTHPPMLPAEFPAILPPAILSRYAVVSHNAEDAAQLTCLGNTSRGTPVWVNHDYAKADLKIVVGNIEPHQFAGFSGGVKSAAVGLAGPLTINHNHALMTHPNSLLGAYENNPARQDVEEIGQMIGVHLAINAILNRHKQIVHVVAGAPEAVMQAGIPLARQVCQVRVAAPYRLVIASPGGHPKDINLYQAQKGLAHAALITRPGGTILLAAACPEGTGSPHYEDWMQGKTSHQQVLAQFQAEGFRIGPHKAYQISRDALPRRLLFCSEMPAAQARALLLNPVRDLQTALDLALADLPRGERIGLMPHAASTIPYIGEQKNL